MNLSPVATIAIIGTGQMGRGIAQVAAQSGFQVQLFDQKPQAQEQAITFIHQQWTKGLEKQKWTTGEVNTWSQCLRPIVQLSELASADLVIEAIAEQKPTKLELFEQLGKLCSTQTILASNTSSISITELGAAAKRAENVVGMHFMNPVPVMKLVEGIRGLGTSEEVLGRVRQVAERMGKVWIEAKDYPGFAVNRILMPMINEAFYALYEGVASAKDLDAAMKLGTNQPMGPLELADFIGLDTCLAIMQVLHEGLGDTKYRPCPLLKQYVAAGRLGRKSQQGVYHY